MRDYIFWPLPVGDHFRRVTPVPPETGEARPIGARFTNVRISFAQLDMLPKTVDDWMTLFEKNFPGFKAVGPLDVPPPAATPPKD